MAREEAERLRHEYVGTEHILLGLIREGEGVAAAVLQNLSVDLDEIQQKIEDTVKKGKLRPLPVPIFRIRPGRRKFSSSRWRKLAILRTTTSAPSICCLDFFAKRRESQRRF